MPETLQALPVDTLCPNPRNPRLIMREDVVESITAQLKESGAFSSSHALLVRAGFNRIVRGHHRWEAARRAGLKEIPCWIREMTDEEEYMELVLGNSQGELSPLEIGIHAFGDVDKGLGGRGIVGGLTQYAKLVGKSQQYISQIVAAAEVYKYIWGLLSKTHNSSSEFLDKAKHLSVIHKAEMVLWADLAEKMLVSGWSVTDTEYWVGKVCEVNIPQQWRAIFLPLLPIVQRMLSAEFSWPTVKKLIEVAERTVDIIHSYSHAIDVATFVRAYYDWLNENSGAISWDVRQLTKKQRQIMAELEKAELAAEKRWNCGDWRGYVGDLDDGSIALLLTDPPYGIEFQSNRRRVSPKHEPIANDTAQGALLEIVDMAAAFFSKMATDSHILCFCDMSNYHHIINLLESAGFVHRGFAYWHKNVWGMGDLLHTFAPDVEVIVHATKGNPMLYSRHAATFNADRVPSESHPTEKPVSLLKEFIELATVEGELVADPFGGVASTLVAAKKCRREFWGCELDAKYHQLGKERLENNGNDSTD